MPELPRERGQGEIGGSHDILIQEARHGLVIFARAETGSEHLHEPSPQRPDDRDPEKAEARVEEGGAPTAAREVEECSAPDERDGEGRQLELHTEARDDPTGHRRADVAAEDDGDGACEIEDARIHEPDRRDGHRARRLCERRDQGSRQQSVRGRVRRGPQDPTQGIPRRHIQAVGHQTHVEQEEAHSAEQLSRDGESSHGRRSYPVAARSAPVPARLRFSASLSSAPRDGAVRETPDSRSFASVLATRSASRRPSGASAPAGRAPAGPAG